MKRIKTLFVVQSLVRAGAETQVVELINRLDNVQFEKHLFTFDSQLDQLSRVDQTYVMHTNLCRTGKFDIKPARALARLIDDNNIDVVHCTLQFSLLMGWLATKLSRRRPALLAAIHTTINRNVKEELQDRVLYQWLLRQCSQIIFVCEAQRQHWIGKFPALSPISTTVHNGINIEVFDKAQAKREGIALRASLGIPSGALVLAHIAGFRPEKAHGLLMKAFKQVSAHNENVFLLFAGDGPLRAKIEQQTSEAGLSNRVKFLGNVSDVRPVLGAADIAVLPSIAVETFSMAMLEALALEVPMVCSYIGGLREAIHPEETGLLVPPGSIPALVEAIERLIADSDLRKRLGQEGRRLVEAQFTSEEMTTKTERILEAVVRKASE